MLAPLLRSRVRSILALALCAPLLLTIHAATPAQAGTQPTYNIQGPIAFADHAIFIIPCGVIVQEAPNGFLYLTDVAGNVLRPDAKDCLGRPARVIVIPLPGYILTVVGPDGKLRPVRGPSVMRPGVIYAITVFSDGNCVCGEHDLD